MKIAIFSILLSLSTLSIAIETNSPDLGDILDFIQKYSELNSTEKISSETGGIKTTKPSNNFLKLDYEGFTVWLDCDRRGAVKFQYNAQRDTGNFKRSSRFFIDPNVPKSCQQYSDKSYKAKGQRYDRGHLVPANHLDYSKTAIKGSNTMTNILPQAANMNKGAWLLTEEITECYRDIDELLIIGGVIWGNNSDKDYFVKSHGVKTPDAFWKVIIRGVGADERAIAWIIPNSQTAKRKQLDSYLVTVNEIERVTGEQIPVADYAKHDKPDRSWMIPRGCNKG
ncbi:MAG: DNA/RNA non-specific endonuclease [Methylomarinum sp.]|nr:DNA/RNA non-specific endonuclease [Methylomarinum sp.]